MTAEARRADRSTAVAILCKDRAALLAYVEQRIGREGDVRASLIGFDAYIAISCPRGDMSVYKLFETADSVPETDVPCACYRPRCWAIQYTDAQPVEAERGAS